jgi:hypothetical protein
LDIADEKLILKRNICAEIQSINSYQMDRYPMDKRRAIGFRGSWFAEVDGEILPCVHQHWWAAGGRYDDPGLQPGAPKSDELAIAILAKKRVILTTDVASVDDEGNVVGFQRTGYVAVYSVAGIEFDKAGLRFKFVKRLFELK